MDEMRVVTVPCKTVCQPQITSERQMDITPLIENFCHKNETSIAEKMFADG